MASRHGVLHLKVEVVFLVTINLATPMSSSFLAPSSDQRWTAVKTRDPTAAGCFFYGAVTTKIFCRPDCPARLARLSNVIFFDDISTAEDAGYRPCMRCHPCDPYWQRDMQSRSDFDRALEAIEQKRSIGQKWTVAAIASELDLSVGHLHRLFKRFAGTTPKQFGGNTATMQGSMLEQHHSTSYGDQIYDDRRSSRLDWTSSIQTTGDILASQHNEVTINWNTFGGEDYETGDAYIIAAPLAYDDLAFDLHEEVWSFPNGARSVTPGHSDFHAPSTVMPALDDLFST